MLENATSYAPNAETAAGLLLAFLAGGMCPVYYFQERMRGFGRRMVSILPYQPPPGKRPLEALEDAVENPAGDDDNENDHSMTDDSDTTEVQHEST
jgi:hypothetical protein